MKAVLFPGQGSQHIGMGQFLFDEFALVRNCFEEASDTLSVDFKKLCFEGDEAELALTHNTQPALLLSSTALFRVLQEVAGFAPQFGAGHSVGEYAAVVNAGAVSFANGLRLVRQRGQEMQKAVPVGMGAMLAVLGLKDDEVTKLCEWAQKESGLSPLEPANYNSPGQVVVSGSAELVQWVRSNFKPEVIESAARKVRLIPLKVSAPFHCSMMKNAEEAMQTALKDVPFSEAQWPIVQNIHGKMVSKGEDLKANLVSQITGAVQWTQCMETMVAQGAETFLECGPGKVLSGLQKKINSELNPCLSIQSLDELKQMEKALS